MRHINLVFAISCCIVLSSNHLISQSKNSSTETTTHNQIEESENNTVIKIKLSEFKMFRLEENVKCCGNDKKCPITGFHLLTRGTIQTYNGGPRFSSASRFLIAEADPGDMFILENIKYKCSVSDSIAYLDDIAFKIVRE